MRPPDEVRRDLVRQWLAKAGEDLAVAQELQSSEAAFTAAIAFHAQQAAEKSLKAMLLWRGVEFPKTHDLDQLTDLLRGVEPALAERLPALSELSQYGVEYRYPGDAPELTERDASAAIDRAAATHSAIRAALIAAGCGFD